MCSKVLWLHGLVVHHALHIHRHFPWQFTKCNKYCIILQVYFNFFFLNMESMSLRTHKCFIDPESTKKWYPQISNLWHYFKQGYPFNWLNSITSLCLSQTRIFIPIITCRGLFFMFNNLRWEIVGHFGDISGTADHHCKISFHI